MSKCWYCNNELITGDNPKHFGICNKCYDEMFKSGDTIIRSLTNKIAELQKQLEQSEKMNKRLYNENESAEKILRMSSNEQTKEILELKKRLGEKEKRLKSIDDWKMNYGYTNYEDIYMLEDLQSRAFQSEDDTQIIDELLDYFNISDENKILPAIKQQLKSQPAEIVEKIREWGQKHYNWVGDGTGYDGQDYNECIGFNKAIDQLNEVLDTILKEYQK